VKTTIRFEDITDALNVYYHLKRVLPIDVGHTIDFVNIFAVPFFTHTVSINELNTKLQNAPDTSSCYVDVSVDAAIASS
tara:strand:+ start:190 stop:426 length:237 start_codon:yes stop_codon:yes gene_type:complete